MKFKNLDDTLQKDVVIMFIKFAFMMLIGCLMIIYDDDKVVNDENTSNTEINCLK